MEKKEYIPPTLEVFEFEVERGFAQSNFRQYDSFLGDTQNESITKGSVYNQDSSLWGSSEWY